MCWVSVRRINYLSVECAKKYPSTSLLLFLFSALSSEVAKCNLTAVVTIREASFGLGLGLNLKLSLDLAPNLGFRLGLGLNLKLSLDLAPNLGFRLGLGLNLKLSLDLAPNLGFALGLGAGEEEGGPGVVDRAREMSDDGDF